MATVFSLICLGPSFQKMTHHSLLHGSLRPTNLEKKSEVQELNKLQPTLLALVIFLTEESLLIVHTFGLFLEGNTLFYSGT